MGKLELTTEQKRIIKKPFIFISYCWNNKVVFERVQRLAIYLKKSGIPVLYDEGGLEAGAELLRFEYNICSENCVCVLVVNDKCYKSKAEGLEGVSGCSREFTYILNDYHDNDEKYIPLKVDAIIPLFKGKVYIPFTDDSKFKEILERVKKKLTGEQQVESNDYDEIEKQKCIVEAIKLYDKEDYAASVRKIGKIIDGERKKGEQKESLARLYNIILINYIRLQDDKNAYEYANELFSMIPSNMKTETKTLYLSNCALAYRLAQNTDKYEECAKIMWQMAKKSSVSDLHHFASLYSTALFETDQYTEAYKMAKTALKMFNNTCQGNEDELLTYIKYKSNVAETARRYAYKQKERLKRYAALCEAEDNISEVVNMLEQNNYDDSIKSAVYGLASEIFADLKDYYK